MKKRRLLKCGAALALGLLSALTLGCFTGFAYDTFGFSTCTVKDKNTIEITGTAAAGTKEEGEEPDDGYYYLFELQPYESGIGDRQGQYVEKVKKQTDLTFDLSFTGTPEDSRLYSRFVMAVRAGNKYVAISNPIYVTNPESVASYTEDYPDAMSKKGLLIELDMLGDAMNLGVKHTTINIPYHHILGGTLRYDYNGKTYYFNQELIDSYDKMISAFSSKGIIVTAILLNGWNDEHPELAMDGVKKTDSALYYGFNVETPEGYETTKALFSFMSERYSGAHDAYGRVSNWIVGNEINNQAWNYVGPMDAASYTKIYERAFRVAYSSIRSRNKNARVFFSVDYEWNRADTNLMYGGREIIELFNAGIRAEGNIHWGLAYHPYPHPLTEPEFWDDGELGLTHTVDSPIVNFYNLNVLTDYFQRSEMLAPDGTVRHIILSEEGFTSDSPTRGKVYDLQAAAFAYAYYLVDANPYIDAFILNRQVDSVAELQSSLAFGLWTVDEERKDKVVAVMPKNIYNVFKYIDTKQSLKHTEFAKSIIGINKWSDVIPGFKLEE